MQKPLLVLYTQASNCFCSLRRAFGGDEGGGFNWNANVPVLVLARARDSQELQKFTGSHGEKKTQGEGGGLAPNICSMGVLGSFLNWQPFPADWIMSSCSPGACRLPQPPYILSSFAQTTHFFGQFS